MGSFLFERGSIMKRLRRLFCNHSGAKLMRWHWCHGPNGNDPRCIEREYQCPKCGKVFYNCITRDKYDLDMYAKYNSDKQEL